MRIELPNLEDGRGAFAHVYQPADFDLADERIEVTKPVSITGVVKRSASGLEIDGRIEGQVLLECDRCLKPVVFPFDSNYSLDYITERDYKNSNAVELTEQEMSVSTFDEEAIDIDDIVREQILLTVPARVLCAEDCKGICPNCGVDLNSESCGCATVEIDPRWESLKGFKPS